MAARGRTPARSQELIFLDPDDDLATVRAKLESSPADEVFLVVPRRASTLRTPLEFRILARLAHELSTDVTIVSADGNRRHLARQEGLRTRRGYGGVRHLAEAAGAPRSWLPGLPGLFDWVSLPSVTAFVVLGLVAIIGAGFALVALPVMRVQVTPRTDSVQRELEVSVDLNQRVPDSTRGLLPGEVMQDRFEVSGSLPATGQRAVGRDPARGEASFQNNSGNAYVLPPRTVLLTRSGVRFLTDSELRITPFTYSGMRMTITAEQKGVSGNVDAGQLTVLEQPLNGVIVTNARPTTGGVDRQARAVAAADHAKLKEVLVQRAREQALAEFQARGGIHKSVPPNTLQVRVDAENYQPAVDAEGDQANGTMTVFASAVAWENQALNTLVQRTLLTRYGSEYDLPMNQLRIQPPEVIETQNQNTRLRLRIRAEALISHTIDPESIRRELVGKSQAEARDILARVPGLTGTPGIEFSPSWAPKAYRVEVSVAAPK